MTGFARELAHGFPRELPAPRRDREEYRHEVCSPEGDYRYFAIYRSLETKRWASTAEAQRTAVVVGCHPTPADAAGRQCWGFARAWDCPTVILLNLFARRVESRGALLREPDPIGPQNLSWLQTYLATADVLLAAWGDLGDWFRRLARRSVWRSAECRDHVRAVIALSQAWQCLGTTRNGSPTFPLFRSPRAPLVEFSSSKIGGGEFAVEGSLCRAIPA